MSDKRPTFPRAVKLKGDAAFRDVGRSKLRVNRGPLLVQAKANGLAYSRLGLRTARKVGTAPVRNRVRRMLREAFRHLRHDLPAAYDFVVTVRPHEPLILAEYQKLLASVLLKLHRDATSSPPRRDTSDATGGADKPPEPT
jgi:ribonuclease P protein component